MADRRLCMHKHVNKHILTFLQRAYLMENKNMYVKNIKSVNSMALNVKFMLSRYLVYFTVVYCQ